MCPEDPTKPPFYFSRSPARRRASEELALGYATTADRLDVLLTSRYHACILSLANAVGARQDAVFLGTLNAGHPGGTLPLTRQTAESFHDDRLPANVYVVDASLFPRSLGNPPILTIVAMAKRISSICRARWSD